MNNECRCGRPTRNDAYACDDCGDSLARALGDVPWLTEELEVTISRQKGVDYRGVGGGKGGKKASERPSPVVWGASEAQGHLKALLVSWALFCEAEGVRNSDPRTDALGEDDDNPDALSGWLLWRVDGLMLHEIAPDAIDEITDAVAKCHRLIDRPADAKFYGRCACGEWLYAKPGMDTIKCRGCGETSATAALNEAMWQEAMDKIVTVAEARILANRMGFELAESTMFRWVAKWVDDGRLIPHGEGDERTRRFSFSTLSVLLEATTQSKAA